MSLDENASALTTCLRCRDEVYFDINTGEEYCEHHLNNHLDSANPAHPVPSAAVIQQVPPGVTNSPTKGRVCAIPDCNRPVHVDDDDCGTIYECCGYRHAMELIRRGNVKSKL